MSPSHKREIHLTSYADGVPTADNFTIVECPLPEVADGQVLVQSIFLSMDPFPRLRMSKEPGLAPQLPLNQTMIGRGVGVVLQSRHPDFREGDCVAGELGWQDYALFDPKELRPVDPSLAPISTSLGILGPSGLAAYFSFFEQGKPKAGQTLVVSAAAGSVGSVLCQLGHIADCNVIGIAGGDEQLDYVSDELRANHVIDYTRVIDMNAAIQDACPKGVDIFVDLVGGPTHDAVAANMAVCGRIVMVGTIASYNDGGGVGDVGPRRLTETILKRTVTSGFLVGDYAPRFGEGLQKLASWIQSGDLTYKEHMTKGLENAPAAFAHLFASDGVGKQLVQISDDPFAS